SLCTGPPPAVLSPRSLHDALPILLQAPPPERSRSSRRSRRRSRHHRAWYRKKRFMFPIVFLFMFMTAGGSAAWYVTAKFNAFNRSEEHTSELQSRENLVCRLLLEK